MITKRRKEILLSADKFLIDSEPSIRQIIPTIVELRTKAKVSNINTASLLTSLPRVSISKFVLILTEKSDRIKGAT
tara:strand:+ start:845 stop:1072 length:228 start_codon:yes stop_codon:yes gene_type:complete